EHMRVPVGFIIPSQLNPLPMRLVQVQRKVVEATIEVEQQSPCVTDREAEAATFYRACGESVKGVWRNSMIVVADLRVFLLAVSDKVIVRPESCPAGNSANWSKR